MSAIGGLERRPALRLLSGLCRRVYCDFLLPDRLEEYRQFLLAAIDRGYEFLTFRDFADQVVASRLPNRTLLLRQDVDTDLATAKRMWRIEQDLGIAASRFFRLSTVDVAWMRQIEQAGGLASYHYEEIADYAKRKRIYNREELLRELPAIQAQFRDNLVSFRAATGLTMSIVASHGDFVNRRLGIGNYELLKAQAFRNQVGVEWEVYDSELTRSMSARVSDCSGPAFWRPVDPQGLLDDGVPVVQVLVHPRHWSANRWENLRANARRAWEGIRFG